MTQVTLAERLRYLRKSRGMSQVELAGRLGLRNNSFISHLERGSRRPSPELLAKIATLFSYDVDSLLLLEGAPPVARDDDRQPELQPVAGADLLEQLRSEVERFGERLSELISGSLPDFLWDREHRLLVEGRAREVWLACPKVAYHGLADDLLRVALSNLERGVCYRYLLLDSKEVRVEAGQLLRRYQPVLGEDGGADLELRFAPREAFPFVFEVALFDPRDPSRALGSLTPPAADPEWEVALQPPQALELAAFLARIWDRCV